MTDYGVDPDNLLDCLIFSVVTTVLTVGGLIALAFIYG